MSNPSFGPIPHRPLPIPPSSATPASPPAQGGTNQDNRVKNLSKAVLSKTPPAPPPRSELPASSVLHRPQHVESDYVAMPALGAEPHPETAPRFSLRGLVDKVITLAKKNLEFGVRNPKEALRSDLANLKRDFAQVQQEFKDFNVPNPKEALKSGIDKLRSGQRSKSADPAKLRDMELFAKNNNLMVSTWEEAGKAMAREGEDLGDVGTEEEGFKQLEDNIPPSDMRFLSKKDDDNFYVIFKHGNNCLPFNLSFYQRNDPAKFQQLLNLITITQHFKGS